MHIIVSPFSSLLTHSSTLPQTMTVTVGTPRVRDANEQPVARRNELKRVVEMTESFSIVRGTLQRPNKRLKPSPPPPSPEPVSPVSSLIWDSDDLLSVSDTSSTFCSSPAKPNDLKIEVRRQYWKLLAPQVAVWLQSMPVEICAEGHDRVQVLVQNILDMDKEYESAFQGSSCLSDSNSLSCPYPSLIVEPDPTLF